MKDYQNEIIISAKRGYPIVLAGAIYFCVLGMLSFFIPEKTMSLVWIFGCGVIFPFAMGLLGASHFLPYIWIYRSKAYVYIASATGVLSIGVGLFLPERVYHVLPFAISIVYAIGVLWMLQENKKD